VADAQSHSLVLAMDYRVPDPARVWPLLQRCESDLAALGAHHVLVYTSSAERGRILVTMAIRGRQPVTDVLRERIFMQWFDAVGVTDIPAVFAGSLIERIEVAAPGAEPPDAEAPGVVVAAVAEVADTARFVALIDRTITRFADAGIRKILVFQAFDNPREVFVLQQADDEDSAARWIDQPPFAADWITTAGVGVYPPVFVGHLDHMMRIPSETTKENTAT